MDGLAEVMTSPLNLKKSWRALLLGTLIVALTLASGMVDRRLSLGLSTEADLAPAGKHLEKLPNEFGNWQLQASRPMDPLILKTLQCSGSVLRKYMNQATGESVDLSLIVGPSGPTSVHTPEVCYSSRDYEQLAAPQKFQVRAESKPAESFWRLIFRSTGPRLDELTVAYAWNDGTGWQASSQPRFQFSGRRLLYKLQLASYSASGEAASRRDPIREFLLDFLPVFDRLQKDSPQTGTLP